MIRFQGELMKLLDYFARKRDVNSIDSTRDKSIIAKNRIGNAFLAASLSLAGCSEKGYRPIDASTKLDAITSVDSNSENIGDTKLSDDAISDSNSVDASSTCAWTSANLTPLTCWSSSVQSIYSNTRTLFALDNTALVGFSASNVDFIQNTALIEIGIWNQDFMRCSILRSTLLQEGAPPAQEVIGPYNLEYGLSGLIQEGANERVLLSLKKTCGSPLPDSGVIDASADANPDANIVSMDAQIQDSTLRDSSQLADAMCTTFARTGSILSCGSSLNRATLTQTKSTLLILVQETYLEYYLKMLIR